MKVAVVDDSMEDRELLAGTAEETLCALGQGQTFMQLFPSGEMLLKDFQTGKYELVFLDIFLEEGALNGIGTAERLRALDSRVKLVFVTTSNDFASESYAVRADGYLLKPISRKALEGLLGRMLAAKEKSETPVTLPDGQTVPARAILFTTCAGHYVTLTLRGEQSLRVRTTQNAMAELLLACPGFVACNKGTLVNLSAVARLEEGRLLMSNGEYLPLSRRRAAEVKKAYFDYQIDDFRKGER